MKFPNPEVISNKLYNKSIQAFLNFLKKHKNILAKYENVEDFVLREEEFTTKTAINSKILQGCEYHFLQIRDAILRELRTRSFYLGASVLNEVLFQVLRNPKTENPIKETLELIRDSGILRPGFVLYPIHSFGVIGAGFLYSFTPARIDFLIPELGLVVTPQTNLFQSSLDFIKRAMDYLGIQGELEVDLIYHWMKSRPLKWIVRNPLMILKIHSFPGEYYENHIFIINKLRIAIVSLMMLNSFQNFVSSSEGFLFSSSRTNNWETFDIKHYLVFYPKPHSDKIIGDCLPMNVNRFTLTEFSELPIDIDPRFWKRRKKIKTKIIQTIINIEKGFYQYSFGIRKKNNKSRVYRKIFRSLEFFRRSFRRTDDIGEQIVNLVIAFEILLTDYYTRGMYDKILERLNKLLKGIRGVKKLKESVNMLFQMRGEYVHSGFVKKEMDLNVTRTAYVYALVRLCEKLDKINEKTETPIKDLIETS